MRKFFRKADKPLFSWLGREEIQDVSDEVTQVYLELSSFCNLNCKTCVRNSIVDFKPVHLSLSKIKKIIPMIKSFHRLERIVLFGYGEALCNPQFKKILIELKKIDREIVLITNAMFLTEKMSQLFVDVQIDKLYVSWDDSIEGGTTSKIRDGADVSSFKKNIEYLTGLKEEAGRSLPKVGLEVVATRGNYQNIPGIIEYGESIGVDMFIVSNLFPYSEEMQDDILYKVKGKLEVDLKKMLKKISRKNTIDIANQITDVPRRCPFLEKGTLFVSSHGDVSPCPELAYSHPAYYLNSLRMHNKYHFGNVAKLTLGEIWNDSEFIRFRKEFLYYNFPDCTTCYNPDLCWHRTSSEFDCYDNPTPCGECLWAKGVIKCP